MRIPFLLFLLMLGLFACSSTEQPTNQSTSKAYFFDLSEYFSQEIKSLTEQANIEKTASINGVEEVKVIYQPNFAQELQLFVASDINRTSWLDKYQVDSLKTQNGILEQLIYTALEEKLRTRKVIINFVAKQVTQVQIVNATDNVIAQTKQELSYIPQQGYNIKSFQDVLFSDPRIMEVKVRFKS